MTVADGFMGAGGWSVALDMLDIPHVGIELDDAPIAVARAAGHDVIQGDIAAFDPMEFAPCEGCCMSPPCPSFSSAGRGAGREISEPILAAIADLAAGRDTRAQRRQEAYAILEPDTARFGVLPVPRSRRKREQRAASPVDRDRIARREAKRATARRDATISLLVVEPLRWALALEPRWVALEQVPPVLPLWEAMAAVLRKRGYSAWTGCLSSERYGVPQTRQRAILIASLDHEVREPSATHQRYIAPRKRAGDGGAATLFDAPEPERIVHREDRDLLPWVSMAEALQWGMTARPSVTVSAKEGQTGGNRPLEAGSGARETLDRARADGEWVDGPRPSPSPSVTAGGTGSGGGVEVFAGREARERAAGAVRFVANGQANATCRDIDEPAPTIATGNSTAERRWEVQTDNFTGSYDAGEQRRYRRPVEAPAPTVTRRIDTWELRAAVSDEGYDKARPRTSDEPAATVTGRHRSSEWCCACCHAHNDDPRGLHFVQGDGSHSMRSCPLFAAPTVRGESNRDVWVTERPSTSVNCDPRIAEPGRHDPDEAGSQYGPATVRVSIEEAAALQSFPRGYPWEAAGTRTAAFKAVGNAIPCLLALHVLAMATGVPPQGLLPCQAKDGVS